MRKVLTSLAISVLLLPALAGSVSAQAVYTVEIQSATLLAKGAAVEVTFDMVCPTGVYAGFQATADVTQRVGGGKVASGSIGAYGANGAWTCDGVTPNHVILNVKSTTGTAFKNGVALVTAAAKGMSATPYAQDVEEMRLQK